MTHRSHLPARALSSCRPASRISPALTPESDAGVSSMISVISAREPSTDFLRFGDIDANPAVARFAEPDKIAADFFRGIDRQGVTGGTVFQTADENADDFAFEIREAARRLRRVASANLPADASWKNSGREICDRIPRSFRNSAFPEDRADSQSSRRAWQLRVDRICQSASDGVATSTFRMRDAAAQIGHQLIALDISCRRTQP